MRSHLFPTVLLFFSLFTSVAFSAEEATVPVLMPGRYVLVLRDDTDPYPLIVNVLKKDDSLLMSVENPDYADTTIRSEDGAVIFQLSRRFKAPQNANLQEELMTFAGVASARVPRAIDGMFSCCSIFGKGDYDQANSPSIRTGTFLLFPIDKEK